MNPVRILLADDHGVMRSGLKHLLSAQPRLTVVGEASSGLEAVDLARSLKPDLVVLDLSMPGMSGLDALKRMRDEVPWVRVLVLTMHDDPEYVRQALSLGAAGYVLKAAADSELITAIRTVSSGGTYVYPTLASRLVVGVQPPLHFETDSARTLTPRETQVLQLLALGYTNQEIAEQLVVGVRTVETFRKRILEKLGLHTRAELVRYALTNNLIQV